MKTSLKVSERIEEVRNSGEEWQDLSRALDPLQKAKAAGIENIELRKMRLAVGPYGTEAKAAYEIWADGKLYGYMLLPHGTRPWRINNAKDGLKSRFVNPAAYSYHRGSDAVENLLAQVPGLIAEKRLRTAEQEAELEEAANEGRKQEEKRMNERREKVRVVRRALLDKFGSQLTPDERAFIEGRI